MNVESTDLFTLVLLSVILFFFAGFFLKIYCTSWVSSIVMVLCNYPCMSLTKYTLVFQCWSASAGVSSQSFAKKDQDPGAG